MPKVVKNPELFKFAQDHLAYNPKTGIFVWRKQASRKNKIGAVAGRYRIRKGTAWGDFLISIRFNGKTYEARGSLLAWYFINNVIPDSITYLNGDTSDLRIENLDGVIIDKTWKPTDNDFYKEAARKIEYFPDSGLIMWKIPGLSSKVAGDWAGFDNKWGYRAVGVSLNGCVRQILVHRLAFYITKGYVPKTIDHINRMKDDNRIINLRECTQAENSRNRIEGKKNTSGMRGVHWDKKNKKWRSQIVLNGKNKNIGRFETFQEAVDARKEAEKKYFGEFAPKP